MKILPQSPPPPKKKNNNNNNNKIKNNNIKKITPDRTFDVYTLQWYVKFARDANLRIRIKQRDVFLFQKYYQFNP